MRATLRGVNEADQGADRREPTIPATSRQRFWLVAVLLGGVVVLGALGIAYVLQRGLGTPQLTPEGQLDNRWGTYMSEREWGTPREAVGNDGWGLSWRGAIDTPYNFADDGIGGISDVNDEFRVSWAFWDERADHVTERFHGMSQPQGDSGEAIVDDRTLVENTPHHAYARLVYRYPSDDKAFTVDLEFAKLDSERMVLSATATNAMSVTRPLDVVLKVATDPTNTLEVIDGGFLMRGEQTAVAVAADPASGWQVSPDKAAIDDNLRNGGLTGNAGGTTGALDFHLDIAPNSTSTVYAAIGEVPLVDAQSVGTMARAMLPQAPAILATRRGDARGQFDGQVAAHEDLYRQALMGLLWNETYYRWDGTSGVDPAWAGKVDAHDVLIVPDKWEFPYVSSWQTGFEALTARLIDPQLAQDQLEFILSDRWQQSDGHVPCSEWQMDQECPPIFAYVVWQLYETTHDLNFLQQMYPHLQAQYDWWWKNNQVGDALFGGGSMGMDNLPRGGGAQADSSGWMAFFARDMVRIATELRDTSAAERYWTDRGRIQTAINDKLWDSQTGFYYDLDTAGAFVPYKSYSGLIPLIAGVVPAERIPIVLDALNDPQQFMSPAGIRSMSASSPLYAPGEAGDHINSNWRGPVWLPINYLLADDLADLDAPLAQDLRARIVANVETDWQKAGRLHQYFDGDTGAGLGADSQAGWTALVANLIAEGWPAPPH
jgi:hypothetical protein